MLLGVRTDSPVVELYLYSATGELLAESTWAADRQLAHGLLQKLNVFLSEHDATFEKLTGLFALEGPGSFTGLRIGLTVLNTLSYTQSIPVVGERGETWREKAVQRLLAGENDQLIIPFYGADARITQPKK